MYQVGSTVDVFNSVNLKGGKDGLSIPTAPDLFAQNGKGEAFDFLVYWPS